MNNAIIDNLLKSAVGSRITQVRYLAHCYMNSEYNVIAVRIEFSGGKAMTVRNDCDGESIIISEEILESADLHDAGRLDVIEVPALDPASLSSCLGRRVKDIILKHKDNVPKLLRIECAAREISISNIGDTLTFDEDAFNQMVMDEGWGSLITISYAH